MIKIFGKATASAALVLTIICCLNIPYAKAQPGATVTMQTFYDELEPYGQWIDDPELGYIWAPDVDQNFKPYATNGHWVETEYGNTWVSDYDWGWAAFHYGRWRYADDYGWEWIPGTEWGPAWVNWRTGGDYYGWAPLGPGIDIDIAFGSRYYAPDNYWVFVPRQYLCSPSINRYYLPANRNVAIIRNTTIINNIYNGGSRRYISGPRPAEIERYTGSRINVYNINNNNQPGATRVRNNTINIYRPQIAANGYGNNQAAPARVINRGSNDDSRNRFNNNYGRNNGNANNNTGFGNSRQWGNQRNGAVQNNNPANTNFGGNNNTGFSRPVRTNNNNINGNQFPQRGVPNPNLNNNTGISNPGSAPANTNGSNTSNPGGRPARENQAFPNTNGQPGNGWRESRNFDRNRNRTSADNQQIQQNQQVQRQQEIQQRDQQMQQNQAQQQQVQQQREQQNQQRQQQMQQQREQQNQQRQQQIQPQQQQQRPARQEVMERRPERN